MNLARIWLVLRFAIGIVFLISTGAKIRAPIAFALGVMEYKILPARLAYWTGFLLIGLEGFLAISHLTSWLCGAAVPLGLVFVAGLGAAVAVNLGRGRALSCYCFGAGSHEAISRKTLARLFLLFLGEAFGFVANGFLGIGKSGYIVQVAGLSDIEFGFVWAVILLMSTTWLLSFDDLLGLIRSTHRSGVKGV